MYPSMPRFVVLVIRTIYFIKLLPLVLYYKYSTIITNGGLDATIRIIEACPLGEQRLMAIRLLHIISDATTSGNDQIFEKVVDAGAVRAIGKILKQGSFYFLKMILPKNTKEEGEEDKRHIDFVLQELYYALPALANMVDLSVSSEKKELRESCDTQRLIGQICKDIGSSGGLESLLQLAMCSGSIERFPSLSITVDHNDILVESYRSLASLCPILTSSVASDEGLTRKWSFQMLLALTAVLNEEEQEDFIVEEFQLESLRGLCSLVKYDPIKVSLCIELFIFVL